MIHHYNEKVMITIRIMPMITMILNTTDTDKCLQDLPEAIDGVGMWEVGGALLALLHNHHHCCYHDGDAHHHRHHHRCGWLREGLRSRWCIDRNPSYSFYSHPLHPHPLYPLSYWTQPQPSLDHTAWILGWAENTSLYWYSSCSSYICARCFFVTTPLPLKSLENIDVMNPCWPRLIFSTLFLGGPSHNAYMVHHTRTVSKESNEAEMFLYRS